MSTPPLELHRDPQLITMEQYLSLPLGPMELLNGHLYATPKWRLALLTGLLRNVGLDAAVRIGEPAVWIEAVEALKAGQVSGAPDQRGSATDEIAAGRLARQNTVATLRAHAPEQCAEAADVSETPAGSPRPQDSRHQGHPGEPCPALRGVAVMRYVRADGSRGAWTTELDPKTDTCETLRARFLEAIPDGETSLIELALRPKRWEASFPHE
jgi:hypothetical protein